MTAPLLALFLAAPGAGGIDGAAAGRFAALALSCVHKEYPNKIAHVLQGDTDVKPPRELFPAFYGCYGPRRSQAGPPGRPEPQPGLDAGRDRARPAARDPRRPALAAAARAHREAALPAVTGTHYEGGHWLGTFAVYLVTGS